ncbi:MAG: cupin domain-containing protein [bacterium]|nr:MAG: cupin domain-containing protein [bacterium]
MNDYHFKLVKFQGDFIWHSHPETDETFIVVQGELRIDFRDGAVILKSGELFVVPKGKEHKPCAKQECQIMLVEPIGTVNTGNSVSAERTAKDQWI